MKNSDLLVIKKEGILVLLDMTLVWYLMSLMMSLDQETKSRILLLGELLSTSHFIISFTSSRRTFWNNGEYSQHSLL